MDRSSEEAKSAIVVVRQPGLPDIRPIVGRIIEEDGPALITELDDSGDWVAGEAVLVMVPQDGKRMVAAAELIDLDGARCVFRTIGPWRPLDRREFPRYATEMRGEVVTEDGEWLFAQILDISLGGARLAVSELPQGRHIEVSIWALGQRESLPCKVIAWNETQLGHEVRVHFGELTIAHLRLVRDLVALLASVESGGFGQIAS
jgi:hypothetical protein